MTDCAYYGLKIVFLSLNRWNHLVAVVFFEMFMILFALRANLMMKLLVLLIFSEALFSESVKGANETSYAAGPDRYAPRPPLIKRFYTRFYTVGFVTIFYFIRTRMRARVCVCVVNVDETLLSRPSSE